MGAAVILSGELSCSGSFRPAPRGDGAAVGATEASHCPIELFIFTSNPVVIRNDQCSDKAIRLLSQDLLMLRNCQCEHLDCRSRDLTSVRRGGSTWSGAFAERVVDDHIISDQDVESFLSARSRHLHGDHVALSMG